MKNTQIEFTAPWKVEVKQEELQAQVPELTGNQVLVKKHYTLISPGTELACLSGGEGWFTMPSVPGYAAASEIVAMGPEAAEGFQIGDRVFHYGKHSRYELTTTSGVFLKVPDSLPLAWAPFTRMATVAMTSTRVSSIELGDYVAVTGLGLIGNMAAQLAGLQGASVIGMDLATKRRDLAQSCGIQHAIEAGADSYKQVMELTGGKGVSTLIEATGVPQVILDNVALVGQYGEAILLGSPRGELQSNVTDLLNSIHLNGRGCVTFKGAHEWRYPLTPEAFVKHSLVRNSEVVFRLMQDGKLKIEPLISHMMSPADAPAAYEGLRNKKDEYLGVLFNWEEV
ncbi:zinc-binding dehydrogenase [Paenibacillus sp. KS-LC4]|uniref:zinc-binding dehydrogenase n=1 Tax=Paenibacillus sp. KS-LC4 TaxID=2979727 RepID=UPI0030CBFE13